MPDRTDYKGLASWAHEYIEAHPKPDFFVGPPDDHQLQRWFILPRNDLRNVYLHRFLRSDEDRALHDHPWDNTSLILDGTYVEHMSGDVRAQRCPGQVYSRLAAVAHRVELFDGPVITLFFTGPVIREWGFHCPQGWRHWREFVSELPGGNHIGKGCE